MSKINSTSFFSILVYEFDELLKTYEPDLLCLSQIKEIVAANFGYKSKAAMQTERDSRLLNFSVDDVYQTLWISSSNSNKFGNLWLVKERARDILAKKGVDELNIRSLRLAQMFESVVDEVFRRPESLYFKHILIDQKALFGNNNKITLDKPWFLYLTDKRKMLSKQLKSNLHDFISPQKVPKEFLTTKKGDNYIVDPTIVRFAAILLNISFRDRKLDIDNLSKEQLKLFV